MEPEVETIVRGVGVAASCLRTSCQTSAGVRNLPPPPEKSGVAAIVCSPLFAVVRARWRHGWRRRMLGGSLLMLGLEDRPAAFFPAAVIVASGSACCLARGSLGCMACLPLQRCLSGRSAASPQGHIRSSHIRADFATGSTCPAAVGAAHARYSRTRITALTSVASTSGALAVGSTPPAGRRRYSPPWIVLRDRVPPSPRVAKGDRG
jgi:hypothetical protein